MSAILLDCGDGGSLDSCFASGSSMQAMVSVVSPLAVGSAIDNGKILRRDCSRCLDAFVLDSGALSVRENDGANVPYLRAYLSSAHHDADRETVTATESGW